MPPITDRTVKVGDVKIFYREAGPPDAPALLLLHGFPSASHMFRDLVPLLANRFYLVAPDLPALASRTCRPAGVCELQKCLGQL
jgi:pimeloyl-ACP methyl ester carboxylesterase